VSITSTQTLSKEVLLKRVFSDPKNYPYGFSRSGDFSIAESKALAAYGCFIAALVDGDFKAQNTDDMSILAAVHGQVEPKDTAQRAWIKYQKRINRPKTGSMYGTKKVGNKDEDELVNDADDDADMSFDD
jgi:uncharacterized protein YifE (UPF0438 family)